MKEIRKEYLFKTTPSLLFNRISSASGLSEWFADNVNFEGKLVTFTWGKVVQKAKITGMVSNKSIRFLWLDTNPATEFEFSINEDELTGDIALIVTDMVEEDEEKDTLNLWDSQIARLKRVIGS
jgi:uncharacterized protein YndB with AHSA1/START domain